MKIFIVSSFDDERANVIFELLAATHQVSTSFSLKGSQSRFSALFDSIAAADVVVGVLPAPQDRERMNVVFEIGIAAGQGLPILLVSDKPALPRNLRDLPFLDDAALGDIDAAIRGLDGFALRTSTRTADPYDHGDSNEYMLRGLPDKEVRVESEFSAYSALELSNYFFDLFQLHGAEVVQQSAGQQHARVEVPDLVVWFDALLPTFGLPLPIEFIRNTNRLPQLRARLRRTLKASGARSLLAVAAEPGFDKKWADGDELILAVTADNLRETLVSTVSLSDALLLLLESAAS